MGERFEYWMKQIMKGETITADPYNYSDFLKYVSANEDKYQLLFLGLKREIVHCDEDDVFPYVVKIWLENKSIIKFLLEKKIRELLYNVAIELEDTISFMETFEGMFDDRETERLQSKVELLKEIYSLLN